MTPRVAIAVREAATAHGVTPEAILSGDRSRMAFVARRMAIKAVRAHTGADGKPVYSLSRLGSIFGVHHTTVIHSLRSETPVTLPKRTAPRILTPDDVRQIRARLAAGEPGGLLAKAFNVDPAHISHIKHRHVWKGVE